MKKGAEIIRTYVDEKTGAKVNVYHATAKNSKGVVLWSGEYHEPVTVEDGIKFDGREKVTTTWHTERYTNTLDANRRAATSNALPPAVKAKIKALWLAKDTAKLEQLATLLDIDPEDLGVIAES